MIDPHLLDAQVDNNHTIARSIVSALPAASAEEEARLEFAIGVAVEAADGLIKMAFRRDMAGDEATLEATQRMVRGYLLEDIDWLA